MDKETIQNEIQEKDALIKALTIEKNDLIQELKKCPLSKREQIQYVLDYGGEDCYVIGYTNNGIIENYLADEQRHRTIYTDSIIEYAFDNFVCENFEDQQEMEALFNYPFGEDNILERYDRMRQNHYVRTVNKHLYEDMADDIIKANVKSFTYDW